MDEAERGAKRIQCPVLVLWSNQGSVAPWYDALSVWRDWADDVRGGAIEGSHFFTEENPEATFKALHEFFAGWKHFPGIKTAISRIWR